MKDAINGAVLKMRAYVLMAYFSIVIDIAESKGLILHPWKQLITGHNDDIEARYSPTRDYRLT
jgi:hypothetical protein